MLTATIELCGWYGIDCGDVRAWQKGKGWASSVLTAT